MRSVYYVDTSSVLMMVYDILLRFMLGDGDAGKKSSFMSMCRTFSKDCPGCFLACNSDRFFLFLDYFIVYHCLLFTLYIL